MQFVVSKQNLQKELGFVQGVVEKKNTIPVLSNILIESVGENSVRLTGTDLDVTIRCDMDAEIATPGSICVQARKLFDIARLLPDAPALQDDPDREPDGDQVADRDKDDQRQLHPAEEDAEVGQGPGQRAEDEQKDQVHHGKRGKEREILPDQDLAARAGEEE